MPLAPRLLAISLAMLALGACGGGSWQELAPQPNAGITFDSKKTYALVLADGDSVRVRHATVVGDSVHWTEQVSHGTWVRQSEGVRLADIRRVELYAGSGFSVHDAAIGLVTVVGAFSILALVYHPCWAFCRPQ